MLMDGLRSFVGGVRSFCVDFARLRVGFARFAWILHVCVGLRTFAGGIRAGSDKSLIKASPYHMAGTLLLF